jgi:hypothetical protein
VVAETARAESISSDRTFVEQFSFSTLMDVHAVFKRHEALVDVAAIPQILAIETVLRVFTVHEVIP